MTYCLPLTHQLLDDLPSVLQEFVTTITRYSPEYSKRLKVHILLHLSDDMKQFGPASLFNTERYFLHY